MFQKKKGEKTYTIQAEYLADLTLLVQGREAARREAQFIDSGYRKDIHEVTLAIERKLGLLNLEPHLTIDWSQAVLKGILVVREKTKEELETEKKIQEQLEKQAKEQKKSEENPNAKP